MTSMMSLSQSFSDPTKTKSCDYIKVKFGHCRLRDRPVTVSYSYIVILRVSLVSNECIPESQGARAHQVFSTGNHKEKKKFLHGIYDKVSIYSTIGVDSFTTKD